jgi:hypothetical protein
MKAFIEKKIEIEKMLHPGDDVEDKVKNQVADDISKSEKKDSTILVKTESHEISFDYDPDTKYLNEIKVRFATIFYKRD